VVDTTTNKLVGPTDSNGDGFPDPDVDGLPGLTLFTTPLSSSELFSLIPRQILRQDFGNLVTVDEQRHRIYAVVPGVVEVDVAGNPINIENGMLVVIDGSSDALAMPAPVPVGEVPTGVAVNSRTNRIYVTNRGLI
jgi:DNA-binding beta-propeller fold protein YncE